MAVYDEYVTPKPLYARAGVLVNYAGAAVSLALIVGVGIWGYKLVVRDVSGIPVIRAMEGEMRVAPDNPGGEVALNEGLSVNEVAAVGEAAPPEDTLLLAPATTQLAEEDLLAQPSAEAGEVVATDAPAAMEVETPTALEIAPALPAGPLNADDILALADQIAGNAAPLTDLSDGEDIGPEVSLAGVAGAPEIDASVPGVAVSLRPIVRPASLSAVASAVATSVEAAVTEAAAPAETAALTEATAIATAPAVTSDATLVSTETIASGTNLVQLGAFPSAEQAAEEWVRLSGTFSDFMVGKEQLIQEATSGGQTFYRLRASGFADLGDARRFCASLVAGRADCIPVVAR